MPFLTPFWKHQSLTYCPTDRQSVRLYAIRFAHSFPFWFSAGIQCWIQTGFADIPSTQICSSVPWNTESPSCSRTAHQRLWPSGHWVLPVLSPLICQLWDWFSLDDTQKLLAPTKEILTTWFPPHLTSSHSDNGLSTYLT